MVAVLGNEPDAARDKLGDVNWAWDEPTGRAPLPQLLSWAGHATPTAASQYGPAATAA